MLSALDHDLLVAPHLHFRRQAFPRGARQHLPHKGLHAALQAATPTRGLRVWPRAACAASSPTAATGHAGQPSRLLLCL